MRDEKIPWGLERPSTSTVGLWTQQSRRSASLDISIPSTYIYQTLNVYDNLIAGESGSKA